MQSQFDIYKRKGYLTIIFGFIGFFIWASFYKIDQGVYCQGFIVSQNEKVEITHETIVLEAADFSKVVAQIIPTQNDSKEAKIISYQPDKIVIDGNTKTAELLTLLQSQYPGWKAFVDGKETEIFLSNYMTMSIVFPKGKHIVEFVYKNKPVIIGGIISYSVFIIVMIVLSIVWIRENKRYLMVGFIWLILLGTAGHYFLY